MVTIHCKYKPQCAMPHHLFADWEWNKRRRKLEFKESNVQQCCIYPLCQRSHNTAHIRDLV